MIDKEFISQCGDNLYRNMYIDSLRYRFFAENFGGKYDKWEEYRDTKLKEMDKLVKEERYKERLENERFRIKVIKKTIKDKARIICKRNIEEAKNAYLFLLNLTKNL